jgi:hypothetical protein
MNELTDKARAYTRALPGGGFVCIELTTVVGPAGPRHRGVVIVERRSDHVRRQGHRPPVVARGSGSSIDAVLSQLFPIAHSDAALGAGLLGYDRRTPALAVVCQRVPSHSPKRAT